MTSNITSIFQLNFSAYCFILCCLSWADIQAQTTPEIQLLHFAEQLFDNNNYNESITEYQRFLFFHSEHPLAYYAFYKTGVAYTLAEKWKFSVYYFRRALDTKPSIEIRSKIRYQLSLALVLGGDSESARIELFKLIHLKSCPKYIKDSARLVYGLLLVFEHQWKQAKSEFQLIKDAYPENDFLQKTIGNLVLKLESLERKPTIKSSRKALLLSTFIPGAGQIYSRKWWPGLNALILNTATSYWLLHTVNNKSYRDSFLIFSLVWYRYYFGNRLHAKESAIQTNQAYTTLYVGEIVSLIHDISAAFSNQSLKVDWEEAITSLQN